MFEKIEESLRPLCMVKDFDDDEIMELCKLSNELNACETTAVLNPSKFASIGTRLGLREGFAVDLTTARANGTMWDRSLEDDRAELRRVQNQEEPELLAGSPPSDDFSSLLNTCVESQEISKCDRNSVRVSCITCGSNVEFYQTPDVEELHFAGPVPDEGDYPTELEGKWRVDGTWIDPKLLIEGRKEEMKCMRKMGVFEVVDEKECYDNGCKMKAEKCRSRLVCREIKRAKDRDEQL